MRNTEHITLAKEEAELLSLLNDKQEASFFKRLVEAYQSKVYNVCLGFLKNEEDAEDLAQEVFIEIYNSIEAFKGESQLSTWIYKIAVNKSLESLRKRKRQKRFAWLTSIFGNESSIEKNYADFVHPGVTLENKERSKVLFQHIEALPENQKIAFTLSKIEQLSYAEISKIMDLSLSSVESLMHRAKKNLQKSLKDYYEQNK